MATKKSISGKSFRHGLIRVPDAFLFEFFGSVLHLISSWEKNNGSSSRPPRIGRELLFPNRRTKLLDLTDWTDIVDSLLNQSFGLVNAIHSLS